MILLDVLDYSTTGGWSQVRLVGLCLLLVARLKVSHFAFSLAFHLGLPTGILSSGIDLSLA